MLCPISLYLLSLPKTVGTVSNLPVTFQLKYYISSSGWEYKWVQFGEDGEFNHPQEQPSIDREWEMMDSVPILTSNEINLRHVFPTVSQSLQGEAWL